MAGIEPHQQSVSITLVADDSNQAAIKLCGYWHFPSYEQLKQVFADLEENQQISTLFFDTRELTGWDSSLITFLRRLENFCQENKIEIELKGLPQGIHQMMGLLSRITQRNVPREAQVKQPLNMRVGFITLDWYRAIVAFMTFFGNCLLSIMRLFQGKAQFRQRLWGLIVEDCGPKALPIVTVISILVGMILAFVGAVQLQQFGAQIYVANLVGLGVAREMGAMMTAVIMAGRTGSAFAAQIGTMQVNEEVDALKTMGISIIDFLVLPRVLSLVIMVPLLTMYANLMGIAGGAMVSIGLLDLTFAEYFQQTKNAISLVDFSVGLIKSVVFGIIIALAGCWRGLECGRSSESVGLVTTSAVVTSIVYIILFDALFTFAFNLLGI